MRYLVSIPKERVTDCRWATVREPVVPCFPSMNGAAFLAVPSFKLAERAEVAEVTDLDPDAMADALAKEYPGLPRSLHEKYVLETWKAVREVPDGTAYRVVVNQKQAILVDLKTSRSHVLWNAQPL